MTRFAQCAGLPRRCFPLQRGARTLSRAAPGFTLIELMVTIAIAAILLAVGVPSFQSIMQSARSSALASDLTSAINLARAEAVKRSAPVRVCPSDDGASCGGAWTDGWIVQVVSDDELLRVWDAPSGDAQITQTPTANALLEFGALGTLTTADTRFVMQMTGCSGPRARELDISPTGRPSSDRVDCT